VDTKTIHIRGMFCVHCEETIRKALLALPGVESADVFWEKEIAVVAGDPSLWNDGLIRKTIEDAGYEVIPFGESRMQIASLLVILLALWVIANHLGWTQVFNLFPRIETSLSIGALFMTGLLTSVHCLAMCGGINLTQSVMASSQKQKILRSNVLYHTGRVLSYTLIGAIAGGIGSVLSLRGIFKGFVAVTAGIARLIMAWNMLGVQGRESCALNSQEKRTHRFLPGSKAVLLF
jgi:copper chaperone CopZ